MTPAREPHDRYNAFRNNCSTRPLDLYFATLTDFGKLDERGSQLTFVLDSVPGITPLPDKTWREAINELEASSPWLVLGDRSRDGPRAGREDEHPRPLLHPHRRPHACSPTSLWASVTPDQEIWGRPISRRWSMASRALSHPQASA